MSSAPAGAPGAKTRIWMFSDVYPPAVAGAAYMTETWREQLTDLGYDVRVFHPSGSWKSYRTPTHVAFRTIKDLAYTGDLHARFSTFAQLRRFRGELPDAVLVSTPGRVGLLGIAIATHYRLPLVVSHSTDLISATDYHSPVRPALALMPKVVALAASAPQVRKALLKVTKLLPGRLPGPLGARFTALALGAAYAGVDELVMLSTKRVDELRSWVGQTPISIVPCGVDRLPESSDPVDLHWPADGLRLISVGRMAKEKNLQLLVEAVAVARRKGVLVNLTFVGEGEMAEPLKATAERLGVGDRVRIMGPYRRPELRSVYADAHVFGFPSTFDTQGFVLNEAAHEGLPILLTDDMVNLVAVDEVSAVIVPNTADDYAAALERLCDPELRAKLGEGARRLAADLDERSQTGKLAELIERAIATVAARSGGTKP